MDNDDLPIGRVLTRREVLALFGVTGAALVLGGSNAQADDAQAPLPSCIVTPEQTEGPYFVDARLNRADIRSDPTTGEVKEGVPLVLTLRALQIGNVCEPLVGAVVDIWHCDALGVYAGVQDRSFDTSGQAFLRGYQVTDENGEVRFTTIYPGWYQGRAVHIHVKVRTDPDSSQGYEFTSQFYFNESVTDRVHAQEPYASKGERTLRNEGDGIYQNGGEQLLLDPSESAEGYAATFNVGLYTN